LLPTVASFDWPVFELLVVELSAVLVEFAPFPVFPVMFCAPHPLVQLDVAFEGAKIISPFWSPFTLNVDVATPSTLVLTAVITVPEVFASPVVIDELPTFKDAVFVPVVVAEVRLFATFALLPCVALALFWSVVVAELFDPAPFPEFIAAEFPLHVGQLPEVPVATFPLPVVAKVELLVAFPVLIAVSPTFPLAFVPVLPLGETFDVVLGFTGAVGATGASGTVGGAGGVGADGAAGGVGASGTAGGVGAVGTEGGVGASGAVGGVGGCGALGAVGAVGTVGTSSAQAETGIDKLPTSITMINAIDNIFLMLLLILKFFSF